MRETTGNIKAQQRVNKIIFDAISFVYPDLEDGEKAILIASIKVQNAKEIASLVERIDGGENELIMRWMFSDLLFESRLKTDV